MSMVNPHYTSVLLHVAAECPLVVSSDYTLQATASCSRPPSRHPLLSAPLTSDPSTEIRLRKDTDFFFYGRFG